MLSGLLLTTNMQKTNVDLTLRKNKYGILITCTIPKLRLNSNRRSLKLRGKTSNSHLSCAWKLLLQIFHMHSQRVTKLPMPTGLLFSIRTKHEIYTVFKIRWALTSMIKRAASRRRSIRRRRWSLSRCGTKALISANRPNKDMKRMIVKVRKWKCEAIIKDGSEKSISCQLTSSNKLRLLLWK